MKAKKFYNLKPLKQRTRENIKIEDEEVSKELVKKMSNHEHFTHKVIKSD